MSQYCGEIAAEPTMPPDGSDVASQAPGVDERKERCFGCFHEMTEGALSIDASAGAVEWKPAQGASIRVCCDDILGVRLKPSSEESEKPATRRASFFSVFVSQPAQLAQHVLVLSAIRRPSAKWRLEEYELRFASAEECSRCCQRVEALVAKRSRPKSLLVFINPLGGNKKARQIYESQAAPVFAAAGIRADVTVTRQRHEAKDFVENKENDLSKYDGIVAVGGDGTFAEVVQGLMLRLNGRIRPGDDISKMEIPLGQIPAGSGNVIAFETTGVEDAMTSALHIACGYRLSVDAATAFAGDELKCLTAASLSYGFFCDLAAESERYRALGRSRYALASIVAFFARFRPYAGSVTFWPANADAGHPFDGQACHIGCTRCSKEALPGDAAAELKSELAKQPYEQLPDGAIKLQGSFLAINSSVHAARTSNFPLGISPNNHICNGTMDLVVVRATSRREFMKHLKQYKRGVRCLRHPFIQTFRIRKFAFEPEEGSPVSNWMSDSEPLSSTRLSAFVHRGALSIFGKGFPISTK